MKRFFRTLLRSFFAYLFLTLVCGASITVITIPALGQRIAAPLCDGTVDAETTRWSQPNGESGTNVEYFCIGEDNTRSRIANDQLFLRTVLYYVGFMTVVVWPLLFLIFFITYGRFRFTGRAKRLREEGIPATATILNTSRSRIAYNTTSEHDLGINIELEVHPPDGQSYRAKSHATLHVMDVMKIAPGMRVGVHIDRKNRQNVAITDWNLTGATTQFNDAIA